MVRMKIAVGAVSYELEAKSIYIGYESGMHIVVAIVQCIRVWEDGEGGERERREEG